MVCSLEGTFLGRNSGMFHPWNVPSEEQRTTGASCTLLFIRSVKQVIYVKRSVKFRTL